MKRQKDGKFDPGEWGRYMASKTLDVSTFRAYVERTHGVTILEPKSTRR